MNLAPLADTSVALYPGHASSTLGSTKVASTTCGRSVVARATKKSPRNMGVGRRVLVTGSWVYDSAGVSSSRLVCRLAIMSLYALREIREC